METPEKQQQLEDNMPMSEDRYMALLGILPRKRANIAELSNPQLDKLEERLKKALRLVYERQIFGLKVEADE